jgi:hypothetical protein
MQASNLAEMALLGFPKPGHPYWIPDTIRRVNARYPGLDMTPWHATLLKHRTRTTEPPCRPPIGTSVAQFG